MANIHTFHKSFEVTLLDPPASQASANSSYLNVFDGFSNAVFVLTVGDVTTNAVDMEIWQATDSSGTGAKKISLADIAAIATTSTGEVKTVELIPGALDQLNGFKYLQARVTVASSGSEVWGLHLLRYNARYTQVLSTQPATYTEQVFVSTN